MKNKGNMTKQQLQKMFEQHRKEQKQREKLLKFWNKLISEGKA